MFIKFITVVFFIFLLAVQASAQSPQVPPEQEADRPAEVEQTSDEEKDNGEAPAMPVPELETKPIEEPAEANSQETSVEVTTMVVRPRNQGDETTFWIALFTAVLAFSTIGLWITALFQSSKMKTSLGESKRSADAMESVAQNIESGTRLNQETFKKQMRGYVCVSVFDTAFQTEHPNSRFGASLKMINTGFTPAYLKSYKIKAAILDGSLPIENALDDAPETPVAAVLGHQQDLTIAAFVDEPAINEDVEIIKFGVVKALFVWGSLCYTDIYEGERDKNTNFCFKIIWLPNGNPWILHYGKYNTAD